MTDNIDTRLALKEGQRALNTDTHTEEYTELKITPAGPNPTVTMVSGLLTVIGSLLWWQHSPTNVALPAIGMLLIGFCVLAMAWKGTQ